MRALPSQWGHGDGSVAKVLAAEDDRNPCDRGTDASALSLDLLTEVAWARVLVLRTGRTGQIQVDFEWQATRIC